MTIINFRADPDIKGVVQFIRDRDVQKNITILKITVDTDGFCKIVIRNRALFLKTLKIVKQS